MKKWLVVSGLVVVMLFGATLALARPEGPAYGPGYGRMYSQERWGEGKASILTSEQKAKFQELRRRFRAENAQLIGALVTKKLELQSLWTDPKADSNAIMEKEKELTGLQNQMKEKMVQFRLEARKSLTPEQITELGARWGMEHGLGRGHKMGRRGMMGLGMEQGMGGMWK